jgi:hypothetical protein
MVFVKMMVELGVWWGSVEVAELLEWSELLASLLVLDE